MGWASLTGAGPELSWAGWWPDAKRLTTAFSESCIFRGASCFFPMADAVLSPCKTRGRRQASSCLVYWGSSSSPSCSKLCFRCWPRGSFYFGRSCATAAFFRRRLGGRAPHTYRIRGFLENHDLGFEGSAVHARKSNQDWTQ